MAAAPTRLQSYLVSLICIALSLFLAPLSFAVALLAYLRAFWRGSLLSLQRVRGRKTVLVNGARATKALVVARAFKRAGHRVILVEEAAWGRLCAARFSAAADRFYLLPDPARSQERYIRRIHDIVRDERVDLWVPCSTGGATVADAEAGEVLRKLGSRCVVWAPTPEMARTLHEKDLFMELCDDLGLETPESKLITSVEQGVTFLHPPEKARAHDYILKSVAFGDDAGRGDLTLLPMSTIEATRRHLQRTTIPISPQGPHVLQRFVRGPEICTHAQVWQGELRSFLCCPSSDLLMRYIDLRSLPDGDRITQLAEDWTRDFLRRWEERLGTQRDRLTGHFSFDFIWEPAEGKLYPIECNPRVHTAVTLLASLPSPLLARSYFQSPNAYRRPRQREPPHSWLSHSLPRALAQHHLPRSRSLHPLLLPDANKDIETTRTWSPTPEQTPLALLYGFWSGKERDAQWDDDDPMPWFALAHIHWPWLLTKELFGRGWSRLNVSTSRIFSLA